MFRNWLHQMEPPWIWGLIYGFGLLIGVICANSHPRVDDPRDVQPTAKSWEASPSTRIVERH